MRAIFLSILFCFSCSRAMENADFSASVPSLPTEAKVRPKLGERSSSLSSMTPSVTKAEKKRLALVRVAPWRRRHSFAKRGSLSSIPEEPPSEAQ